MSPAPVTSLYAAILALLFVVLAVRVIGQRRQSGVALGVANDRDLERVARVHANFAEYVPLALILMLLVELSGFPYWSLHLAGMTLLIGRASHAFGVSRAPEDFRFRVTGVAMTLTAIILLAVGLLFKMALALP